jgi:hypothetical protein
MSALILGLPLDVELQVPLLLPILYAHFRYYNFMRPLMNQARRRTIPVVVFDDLDKLDHLNMLAEITRCFKILEDKSANFLMISSNEETWAKLRREPGMKDRLRVRHIKYDHTLTARLLMDLIDRDPEQVKKYFNFHPLFSFELIKELVRVFIGIKKMSIRRFASVLKLVDEEEYEHLT